MKHSTGNQDEDVYFWEEISDKLARDKVSHALRFAVSQYRQDANRGTTTDTGTRIYGARLISPLSSRGNSNMDDSMKSSSSSSSLSSNDESICNGHKDDENAGSTADKQVGTLYERQQRILDSMKRKPCSNSLKRISSSSSCSYSFPTDNVNLSAVEAIENNNITVNNGGNFYYSRNDKASFVNDELLSSLNSEDLQLLQLLDHTEDDLDPIPLPLLRTSPNVSSEDWKLFATII